MYRLGLWLSLIGLAASGVAQAAYRLELKNMDAVVHVIAEDRKDVTVSVQYPKNHRRGADILVMKLGNRMRLDGQGRAIDQVKRALPKITVILHTPKDVEIDAHNGYFIGDVSPCHELSLRVSGDSQWTLGDVSGNLRANLVGDGHVSGKQARFSDLSVSGGAGRIDLIASGPLEAAIGGQGTISLGQVSHSAKIALTGPGRFEIKKADLDTLDLNLTGEGVARIEGQIKKANVTILGNAQVQLPLKTGALRKTILGKGGIKVGP